jgi:hypothetical protein
LTLLPVAPYDKTERTTDITKGKNSSLSTINISKHRKPSYRYITSTERNQRMKIVALFLENTLALNKMVAEPIVVSLLS